MTCPALQLHCRNTRRVQVCSLHDRFRQQSLPDFQLPATVKGSSKRPLAAGDNSSVHVQTNSLRPLNVHVLPITHWNGLLQDPNSAQAP